MSELLDHKLLNDDAGHVVEQAGGELGEVGRTSRGEADDRIFDAFEALLSQAGGGLAQSADGLDVALGAFAEADAVGQALLEVVGLLQQFNPFFVSRIDLR